MGLMRYSDRDELPLDGARDRETDRRSATGPWIAPTSSGPLRARMSLPGSKSLTNRELVLAALADGPSVVRRPLHSRDTALMVEALRALGAGIHEQPGDGGFGPDLRVAPAELAGGISIEAGLAGTVMRFVPIVAALALGPVAFDGDPSARRRPMRTTIQALRDLGVDVADDGTGTLPFTVHGTGEVQGGELAIDASASSQFVSGLLLAAPRFIDGLVLRHTGERLPSMPHIEMTIAVLAARGVTVESPEPGVWIVPPAPIRALDVTIEPDLSNAAPFLAAALVAGGSVTVTGWPASTTQVGDRLLDLLPRYGARIDRDGDVVTVTGRGAAELAGVELELAEGGELAPTFAGLAALAGAPGRITGIAHLRGHETDRLAALAADLGGLGARVTELDDGLAFEPAPLQGGPWRSYEDHRMATTGALVGLAVEGVAVDDIGATAKTLPEFPELWSRMLRGGDPLRSVDPLLWPGV
ncbi:3-phosphoshikimate 1-carboxyvinyltransferase [Pseudolysinimonas sp.]|uniref:3-phosphoshikimate 1-carboxyvinyltransferase n=1 Tax=Pseudolysinimonas sp. TaxID=2680009 RepID=UPI003F7FB0FA